MYKSTMTIRAHTVGHRLPSHCTHSKLQCCAMQAADHAGAPEGQERGEVDVTVVFTHVGAHPREVGQCKDTPLTGLVP